MSGAQMPGDRAHAQARGTLGDRGVAVAQRLRELTETGGPIGRPDGRRRLVREVDRLCNLLGF